MPHTLRHLLDPATAERQITANPPAASGFTERGIADVIRTSPDPNINLDVAIGGARGPQDAAIRERLVGGREAFERGRRGLPGAGREAFLASPEGRAVATGGGAEFRGAVDRIFGGVQQKSEEDILAEERERVQDQLNAINRISDIQVSRALEQGEGRLGRTQSLASAGGISVSPRGQAQLEQTRAANEEIISAIQAARARDISGILSGAETAGRERVESGLDRAIQRANLQLEAAGLGLRERESLRADERARAGLTGLLGGEETLGLRQFLAGEESRSFQERITEEELELAISQADAAGNQIVQADNGDILLIDRATGDIQNLGNFPKPGDADAGGGALARRVAASTAQRLNEGADPEAEFALLVEEFGIATARTIAEEVENILAAEEEGENEGGERVGTQDLFEEAFGVQR